MNTHNRLRATTVILLLVISCSAKAENQLSLFQYELTFSKSRLTSNFYLSWRPGFASIEVSPGSTHPSARIPLYSTDPNRFSLLRYKGTGSALVGLATIGALAATAIQAKRDYDEWSRNLEEQIIEEELGGWDQVMADLDELLTDLEESNLLPIDPQPTQPNTQ